MVTKEAIIKNYRSDLVNGQIKFLKNVATALLHLKKETEFTNEQYWEVNEQVLRLMKATGTEEIGNIKKKQKGEKSTKKGRKTKEGTFFCARTAKIHNRAFQYGINADNIAPDEMEHILKCEACRAFLISVCPKLRIRLKAWGSQP